MRLGSHSAAPANGGCSIVFAVLLGLGICIPLARAGEPAPPPTPKVDPAPPAPVEPDINFPDLPAPVPQPPPPPTPDPTAIPRLVPGQLYVVAGTSPFTVKAYPRGLVTVTRKIVPAGSTLTLYGNLVGMPGKSRDFGNPTKPTHLAIVEVPDVAKANPAGGRATIAVVPVGTSDEASWKERDIDVGPVIPPAPPVPPTPPTPPTPAAPFSCEGLHVLFVYDSAAVTQMPAAQQAVIFGSSIRTWLNAHCPAGADGKTHEWRIWDPGTDVSGESAVWQAAMKVERKSVPWVVISDGKTGFSGPMPATADETLSLLKKYGG